MPNFLGLPVWMWGVACLGVAVVYFIVWPKPKPGSPPRPVWAHFVLRHMHSLVWIALAGACFLWAVDGLGMAYILARLALIGYMTFIGVFALDNAGKLQQ